MTIPDSVVDAAIAWALKLEYDHPQPEVREAFASWLVADPLHAVAWQRVHSLTKAFSDLPSKLARDVLESTAATRKVNGRRKALKLLSIVGMGGTTIWVAHQVAPWQRLVADASTTIGEQRTLQLSDGTTLMLNTDSAVSTRLTAQRRQITLHRGEIQVTTGPDRQMSAKRPFWVHTPFGNMQALGTRFVVRLDKKRARVSVQEDAVELHPARSSTAVIVRTGESYWLTADAATAAEPPRFEVDAWTDGVISGQDIRLADLLAELSRYRSGRIICDERVENLRVSGIFHVKNTDQALRFLAQTQPIRMTYRTRFWVTVEPQA